MIESRLNVWLRRLSYASLAIVVVVAGVVLFGGERYWFSAALSYLPRLPWLLPSLLLLPVVAAKRQWGATVAALAALAVVLWPLMNVRLGIGASDAGEGVIRFATCNVQGGNPAFDRVLGELDDIDPDVIAFQECDSELPSFARSRPDFSTVREASFLVSSRWPVKPLGLVESDSMRRWCGGVFRIDHPSRPFVLVNVHCSTARHGLASLRDRERPIGDAIEAVNVHQALREGEMFDLSERVAAIEGLPVVLAGDFNQPPDGTFVRRYFGDWENAFDSAGVGYGYTAPCDTSRLWPANFPWLRIDHILFRTSDFGAVSARIGQTAGSDHRLVAAELTWGG